MTRRLVIAHATELSGDDTAAFVHACGLAAASGARLVSVHAGRTDPSRLPDAGPLARKWQRPIEQERLCDDSEDDVADTVLDALRGMAPALLVVGTHARHGVATLLRGSVAEALARNVAVPTLIVPNDGRGFVDPDTGAIDLCRLLVPAGDAAIAARGVDAARTLATLAGARGVEITVLHAGKDGALEVTSPPGIEVVSIGADESIERAIEAAIRDRDPCAVVMPTHGHDSPGDALFGSRTEHVVRDGRRPVLSIPLRPPG